MATNEIHVGDAGIDFVITVSDGSSVIDLSSATTTELRFQKPDGAYLIKSGMLTTDGTDGKVQYTTISTDLDQPGTWRIQVYFVIGPEQKHSNITKFKVYPNLPLEL